MNIDRIKTITFTFYFIFFVIVIRLFYIQVLSHDRLSKLVLKQTYKTIEIPPIRGEILDSLGNNLAYNKTLYQASLYKPNLKDLSLSVNSLISQTPTLSPEDISTLQKFETNPSQKWITLKHFFTENEINSKEYQNIIFDPVNIRQYSNPEIYHDITLGLEKYYQKYLAGRYGFGYQNQDAFGNTIMSDKNWVLNPVHGSNLHTTINPIIQYFSYQSLKKNITKFEAQSGSIIVMEPKSGHVLAMISLESTSSAVNKNRIITDLYEPGSIFKPLVMASALDNKSVNINWTCNQCNRPRVIGEYTIENWDKNVHPDSSLKDIIKNSDNIGMSYIASSLGKESFLKYFYSLGMGRKTGIDLQGESKPPLKKYWPDIDLATASFGQGFSLTQMQMITAFNILANNGYYQNPSLSTQNQHPPQQIFKPETIAEMNKILEYSVNNSPVSNLNNANLSVCAKSGTAQIANGGKYSETDVVASYIGYFPCNTPKYTILVTLDRPRTSAWGSSTAAPIWFDLALNINPLL